MGDEEAAMGVGDEAEAEPGEGGRQSSHRKGRARDLERVPLVGVAVRAGAGERAGARDQRTLQDRAAGHRHTLL